MKKVTKIFCIILCMLYIPFMISAAPGMVNIWIEPVEMAAYEGAEFQTEIHINSQDSIIAAYGFAVGYDTTMVDVDTSLGTDGVQPGTDGFLSTVNTGNPGIILISGFDAEGKGPGEDMEFVIINWIAKLAGRTAIALHVRDLVDPLTTPLLCRGYYGNLEIIGYLFGDANDDGIIDIVDALVVARFYVGLDVGKFQHGGGDVDGNGKIEIVDALLIARRFVGLINEFPGKKPGVKPRLSPRPQIQPEWVESDLVYNPDISIETNTRGTFALVSFSLPDASYFVRSWGNMVKEESAFIVDIKLFQDPSLIVPAVLVEETHRYYLGVCDPGTYEIVLSCWGNVLTSVPFTIEEPGPGPE